MSKLLAALLALVTTAAAAEPTTRVGVPLVRRQLANGLVVILHEDHHLPTVTVTLGVRVGSKDEPRGRTGFAHLFEHLMFMGTARVPDGQFDAIMEAAGGQNNASTTTDRTLYVDWGPAPLLETLLWLESDRLATLPDAMTRKKLELQRDVVENERREDVENRPYGRADLLLPSTLYPADHPYHHAPIGSFADLRAARVDDVKAFFRRWYVPANATLVIVGDFDGTQAQALVDKYFAWMPKRPAPVASKLPPPRLTQSQHVTLHDDVALPRIVRAWITPADFTPGDAECDLVAALLGSGKSSRLYQSLVYAQKLAQSVDVAQESAQLGSQLVITITAQPGHTAAELEAALDAELARLVTSPPTEAELIRARGYVEIETLHEVAEPARLAEQLFLFEQRFADPTRISTQLLGRYDLVTLPDVLRVTQTLAQQPHVTLAVEPGAPTEPTP